MPSPQWYLSRLGRMSAAEIGFRAWRLAQGGWQRLTWRPPFLSSPDKLVSTRSSWFSSISQCFEKEDIRLANGIVAGELRLLGMDQFKTCWPPDWNMDPKTGRQAPLEFGKHIDYRDEEVVGDIKYVWELNRHLEFPVLATAFRRTGDKKYLDALFSAWQTWITDCPFPRGPNWCSSLECSIRLINWSITWQILQDDQCHYKFAPDFHEALTESIQRHIQFIRSYYSRHSSANNHIIGEAAGILIAHKTWSGLSLGKNTIDEARDILIHEALAQISSDGVTREQAIGYMPFILEFMLLAGVAMSDADSPLPVEFWHRIETAINFLDVSTDTSGHIANFGDNDDGAVIRLWGYEIVSRLQGLRQLAMTASQLEVRTCKSESVPGGKLPDFDFSDGGYFVLRSRSSEAGDIHCVADCGPLGYLATAAHGHADALSFTLNVDGQRFLIDPGTYAYHTERQWRDYFRSTAAHNTVRVDGLDQSEIAGSFMWRRAAISNFDKAEDNAEFLRVAGSHDGYLRLTDPVTHRRQLTLHKHSGQISVSDEITCNAEHEIEQFWHIAPECEVEIEPDSRIRISNQAKAVCIAIHSDIDIDFEIDMFRGSEAPILGWCSDRFDQKIATTTVRWRGRIDTRSRLRTTISIVDV